MITIMSNQSTEKLKEIAKAWRVSKDHYFDAIMATMELNSRKKILDESSNGHVPH